MFAPIDTQHCYAFIISGRIPNNLTPCACVHVQWLVLFGWFVCKIPIHACCLFQFGRLKPHTRNSRSAAMSTASFHWTHWPLRICRHEISKATCDNNSTLIARRKCSPLCVPRICAWKLHAFNIEKWIKRIMAGCNCGWRLFVNIIAYSSASGWILV